MKIKIVNKIIHRLSTNNIIVYNNVTGKYITNMYKKKLVYQILMIILPGIQ